ncbi:CPBP family intramembrane metalloprotease [Haloferax mediterranei ATCC 33500]|uniref:CAAX protease n=1 Tax=Haloferax mediterranei (strain ATCC 33500 / DSM 1411 / JCM 8866 / NBRC 14739 / NCIMB 2177 / R-4) TaxID=523841 RepID=I3R6N3_HALMT|nr:CPBP family intramembrane glutamic endopeptidase [Haloferax mediterranei]AFK19893.1 hypothetical protein HFX_2204 [Haloferax mediterranei ATCC 33500]AHZ23272.1 CAAX protease [Haloferax mediterranei ATCC 33500]ELZ99437.1 hypothetical protein C439_12824 [Haloferax mediterranei ATCC 33500]MDX5987358.1 CPBP family intramembrane glutamic endopeptidase [Haloferax mediterranei ATCC 33500]QCQ73866.1 CPBP family intramembrane metalloprotease [Haloferax mediterranei ATCC 33500]
MSSYQKSGDAESVPGLLDRILGLLLPVLSGTFLGAGGLALGAFLSVISILALSVAGYELTPTALIVIGLITTQGVGCFATALTYAGARHYVGQFLATVVGDRSWVRQSKFRIPARVPSTREALAVVVTYVLTFVGIGIAGYTISQLGLEGAANSAATTGLEHPHILLLLVPASILLIGPGEELLFRGVVQGRLRERFGPVLAIGLTSLLFASIHYVALTGAASARLVTIGLLLVPALAFGTVYEYSDNIVVPSLVHGLYNATLFGVLYIGQVYVGAPGA